MNDNNERLKITRAIDRLRKLTQVDIINDWYDVSIGNTVDNLSDELVLEECTLASVNEKGYIIPGLGDAGDLAFGNKLQQ